MENPIHRYGCEVPFSDTDASGWVHFSKTLVYAERAEHDFLNKRGLDVFDRGKGGWPRVKVSCQYKRPLTFQDKIEVLLALDHIGSSSQCWKFEIIRDGEEVVAMGEMVTVKVDQTGSVACLTEEETKLLEERS